MPGYQREITLRLEGAGCDRAGAPIVRGVTFDLAPGDAIQLFGANGSGKTSLLYLVAGQLSPAEGRVAWMAQHEERQSPFPHSVLLIGHEASIKPALTALENLIFWADLYGVERANRDRVINDALDRVGMSNFVNVRVGQFSAGQKRRIDLARAAIAKREVWLMDEPVAALDQEGALMFRNMMSEHLGNGGIALVATHDEFEVASRKLEIGA